MIRAQHIKNAKTAPTWISGLFFFCALTSPLLFSCRTADFSAESALFSPYDVSAADNTRRLCEGISLTSVRVKPLGVQYHLVKIDLSNPSFEFCAAPAFGEWRCAESVKTFARRTNALIALNTVPFYAQNRLPFAKVKPAGLVIIDGTVVSEPRTGYCALAFFTSPEGLYARIFQSQADCQAQIPAPEYAFGGFWGILNEGSIIPFQESKDYRIAAGLADGGKTLFLLAGKNLSFYDCAVILKNAGADSAMEFDGGSSSQLCVMQKRLLMKFDRNPAVIWGIKQKH